MQDLTYFLVQELDLIPSTGVTLPTVLGLQTQDKIANNKEKKETFVSWWLYQSAGAA